MVKLVIPGAGESIPFPGADLPSYPEEAPDPTLGDGLRVVMSKIEGLTKKGLLDRRFMFQVPPLDQIEEGYGFNHQEFGTVGSGTFSRPTGRQLRTVSFNTMVVDFKPVWSLLDANDETDWVPDPLKMKSDLVDICESGTPFQLAIHQVAYDGQYDVRWPAKLTTLQVDQRAGELGTRYLNVTFSEFRDPTVQRKLKGAPRKGPPKGTSAGHKLPATVDLVGNGTGRWKGHIFHDVTLASLARYFYGSPSRWRAIATRNGIDISPNRPIWNGSNALPSQLKNSRKLIVPRLG